MPLDRAAINDSRQRRALGRLSRQGFAATPVGHETPTGTMNGANADFALGHVPDAASLLVFKNGLLMSQGASDDYTISGGTITFAADQLPQAGDKIRVFYREAN